MPPFFTNWGPATASNGGILTASATVQPLGGPKQLNAPASATVPSLEFNNPTRNWISFGAVGNSAPAFTTRPVGVKIVLNSQLDGTTVDYSIGVEAGATWIATARATSSFATNFYAGITKTHILRGDGLLDSTGTIRATGQTAPSSGTGLNLSWNGSRSILLSFNHAGSTYQPIAMDGSQVELRPSGTTQLSVITANSTFSNSVIFASFTQATVPSAASNTRGVIWVSDMTGGAQLAYSDGTNWRRVSDNTVMS